MLLFPQFKYTILYVIIHSCSRKNIYKIKVFLETYILNASLVRYTAVCFGKENKFIPLVFERLVR